VFGVSDEPENIGPFFYQQFGQIATDKTVNAGDQHIFAKPVTRVIFFHF